MIRAHVLDAKTGKLSTENDARRVAKHLYAHRDKVWVDLEEPTLDEINSLETVLGFHPLTVEDVLHGSQRPKIDPYGKYVFIVVRGLNPTGKGTEQLSIYLGKNFIVTVNLRPIESLNNTFEKVKRNPLMLKRGPDFVAYAILDSLVDGFFPILERIDDDIERVEDRIFKQGDNTVLENLFKLKRDVITLRRVAWPMRDIANAMARRDFEFVTVHNAAYFRDVYDHLLRITESTENMRDLITSSMEGYLSVVSNNLNNVMKKLTSITLIVMLPTLIASIYGMNVTGLVLADTPASFEILLAAMAIVAAGSYVVLHKTDWI